MTDLPTHGFSFAELTDGQTATLRREVTESELVLFANASGNGNPLHLPDGHAAPGSIVAPSMWVASLFSAILGNLLPGPGTLYVSQSVRFAGRAHLGETVAASVTILRRDPATRAVALELRACVAGQTIATGDAEVIAPEHPVPRGPLVPPVLVPDRAIFERYLQRARALEPMTTAVVAPDEEKALGGALLAWREGLILPILVGNPDKIRATARALGAVLGDLPIEEVPDADHAAARAVELVHEGRAAALMKGNLHTDILLRHVIKSQGGLRGARRLSHVFIMDVPGRPEPLLISDAAINILPDLDAKVDITQNAIDLAHALGITRPRVGVLSAVETVSSRIPSSMDAAILAKMAERGQITGADVDGPLAMDNAIDAEAARTKGLISTVAGRADILIVPGLETGNVLAKELTFIARAAAAGLVLGARVPIILTSRSDSDAARLDSCAIAVLYQRWKRGG